MASTSISDRDRKIVLAELNNLILALGTNARFVSRGTHEEDRDHEFIRLARDVRSRIYLAPIVRQYQTEAFASSGGVDAVSVEPGEADSGAAEVDAATAVPDASSDHRGPTAGSPPTSTTSATADRHGDPPRAPVSCAGEILQPFIRVIVSEETNAGITGTALTSFLTFLELECSFLTSSSVRQIVAAIQGTHSPRAETGEWEAVLGVLLSIYALAVQLFARRGWPVDAPLMASVVRGCFRIYDVAPTKHLKASAEQALKALCRTMLGGGATVDASGSGCGLTGTLSASPDGAADAASFGWRSLHARLAVLLYITALVSVNSPRKILRLRESFGADGRETRGGGDWFSDEMAAFGASAPGRDVPLPSPLSPISNDSFHDFVKLREMDLGDDIACASNGVTSSAAGGAPILSPPPNAAAVSAAVTGASGISLVLRNLSALDRLVCSVGGTGGNGSASKWGSQAHADASRNTMRTTEIRALGLRLAADALHALAAQRAATRAHGGDVVFSSFEDMSTILHDGGAPPVSPAGPPASPRSRSLERLEEEAIAFDCVIAGRLARAVGSIGASMRESVVVCGLNSRVLHLIVDLGGSLAEDFIYPFLSTLHMAPVNAYCEAAMMNLPVDPERTDVALESLLQWCADPLFAAQLWAGFDLSPHRPGALSQVCTFLSRFKQAPMPSQHASHCLNGFLAFLAAIAARARAPQDSAVMPPLPVEVRTLQATKAILLHVEALFVKSPKSGIQFLRDLASPATRTKALSTLVMVPGPNGSNICLSVEDLSLGADALTKPPFNLHGNFTGTDVGRFLHHFRDVFDKKVAGEYLSSPGKKVQTDSPATELGSLDFHRDMLKAYVECFDFADLPLLPAIRIYLAAFRLPGEAQCIDRMMESFSMRWYSQNANKQHPDPDTWNESSPGAINPFLSDDAVVVFAFSIIMLNTDLHSKKVDDKIKVSDWVKNNRRINSTGPDQPQDQRRDIPERYQALVYRDILQNEIKMSDAASSHLDDFVWSSFVCRATAARARQAARRMYPDPVRVVDSAESAITWSVKLNRDAYTAEIRSNCVPDGIITVSLHQLDRTMFPVVWPHAVHCLSYLLRQASSDSFHKRVLLGFYLTARIASNYQEVVAFDRVLLALLEPLQPFVDDVLRLGAVATAGAHPIGAFVAHIASSPRVQSSLRMALVLACTYPQTVDAAWVPIFRILFALHAGASLPDQVLVPEQGRTMVDFLLFLLNPDAPAHIHAMSLPQLIDSRFGSYRASREPGGSEGSSSGRGLLWGLFGSTAESPMSSDVANVQSTARSITSTVLRSVQLHRILTPLACRSSPRPPPPRGPVTERAPAQGSATPPNLPPIENSASQFVQEAFTPVSADGAVAVSPNHLRRMLLGLLEAAHAPEPKCSDAFTLPPLPVDALIFAMNVIGGATIAHNGANLIAVGALPMDAIKEVFRCANQFYSCGDSAARKTRKTRELEEYWGPAADHSFGVGLRIACMTSAQLSALQCAEESGAPLVPVPGGQDVSTRSALVEGKFGSILETLIAAPANTFMSCGAALVSWALKKEALVVAVSMSIPLAKALLRLLAVSCAVEDPVGIHSTDSGNVIINAVVALYHAQSLSVRAAITADVVRVLVLSCTHATAVEPLGGQPERPINDYDNDDDWERVADESCDRANTPQTATCSEEIVGSSAIHLLAAIAGDCSGTFHDGSSSPQGTAWLCVLDALAWLVLGSPAVELDDIMQRSGPGLVSSAVDAGNRLLPIVTRVQSDALLALQRAVLSSSGAPGSILSTLHSSIIQPILFAVSPNQKPLTPSEVHPRDPNVRRDDFIVRVVSMTTKAFLSHFPSLANTTAPPRQAAGGTDEAEAKSDAAPDAAVSSVLGLWFRLLRGLKALLAACDQTVHDAVAEAAKNMVLVLLQSAAEQKSSSGRRDRDTHGFLFPVDFFPLTVDMLTEQFPDIGPALATTIVATLQLPQSVLTSTASTATPLNQSLPQ